MNIRSTGAPVYRLKVTLRDIEPPVWRRFLVPADISLKRLHDALQAVMGWSDSHLHEFEAGGVLFGTSDKEFGVRRVSERTTKLDHVLRRPRDRMRYQYDFGDSWDHDVQLEAILPRQSGGPYPVIEDGARACPPEDVGGLPGYEEFLEAIRDPQHPEHRELLNWAGSAFDPEAFDAGDANRTIHGGKTTGSAAS